MKSNISMIIIINTIRKNIIIMISMIKIKITLGLIIIKPNREIPRMTQPVKEQQTTIGISKEISHIKASLSPIIILKILTIIPITNLITISRLITLNSIIDLISISNSLLPISKYLQVIIKTIKLLTKEEYSHLHLLCHHLTAIINTITIFRLIMEITLIEINDCFMYKLV